MRRIQSMADRLDVWQRRESESRASVQETAPGLTDCKTPGRELQWHAAGSAVRFDLTFRGTGNTLGAAADFFISPGIGNSIRTAGRLVGGVAGFAGDTGLTGARIAARSVRDRRLRALVETIEAAEEADDYPRLLTLAREFAQRAPQESMGLAWQAKALAGMENYDEAILATERAERLGLPESDCHALRAEILAGKGDYAGAAQELTFLVDDPELSSYALVGRATALLEVGDLDQALRDANRAISVSPDAVAYFTRGNIYRTMGELVNCIADYDRADEIHPNWTVLLENRADVAGLLGRTDEADADRAAIRDASNLDSSGGPMVEVRELLAYLHQGGVQIEVARNGSDLETRGTALRDETRAALAKLKPQLLALLRATENDRQR